MIALFWANLKMMARNRQATFWALFFPLIFVVVFGLFDFDSLGSSRVGVVAEADSPVVSQVIGGLAAIYALDVREEVGPAFQSNVAKGRLEVEQGDLDYLLILPPDPSPADGGNSDGGQLTRTPATLVYASGDRGRNQLVIGAVRDILAQAGSGAPSGSSAMDYQAIDSEASASPGDALLGSEAVEVSQVSYFDQVLMGLVAMGIMTNAIISISVRISNYRNLSILKRLLVTPLPIWKYFVGEVGAHLMVALVQAAIIMSVGVLVFGAKIHGNLAWILVIVVLGSLVFLNIGFIVSGWTNNPAAASGMGNAIALPMMFFAGTFFPTAALPWVLPYVAEALPLTPMLVALRDVANAGEPLWNTWPQLAILGGWVLATGAVATKVFRFN